MKLRLYGDAPLEKITDPLLHWYGRNQRILPWRENTEAYRVWVSEIMLQQTRVDTVVDYYRRFMEKLPDVSALAAVEEETLMKLWEGLGYYARAKNLQKAAKQICTVYGGVFPSAYQDILSLPGIGPYTAGAIRSIAFEQPAAAVDGNVLRVITRLTACSRDIGDAAFRSAVAEALEDIYPPGKCGAFTQSLMELGAVVCVPNGAPHCERCPLFDLCCAGRTGTQADYPVKKPKALRKKQQWTVLLLTCGAHIAIRKRAEGGLLGGLWELPNIAGLQSEKQLQDWLFGHGIKTAGSGGQAIVKQPVKKHIFTHVEWELHTYAVQCGNMPCTGSGDLADSKEAPLVWVHRDRLRSEIALPTAFRKLIK